jgi:hypothetical protein
MGRPHARQQWHAINAWPHVFAGDGYPCGPLVLILGRNVTILVGGLPNAEEATAKKRGPSLCQCLLVKSCHLLLQHTRTQTYRHTQACAAVLSIEATTRLQQNRAQGLFCLQEKICCRGLCLIVLDETPGEFSGTRPAIMHEPPDLARHGPHRTDLLGNSPEQPSNRSKIALSIPELYGSRLTIVGAQTHHHHEPLFSISRARNAPVPEV